MKLTSVAAGLLAALLGIATGLILSMGGVFLKTNTTVHPPSSTFEKDNGFLKGQVDYGSRQGS